MVAPDDRCRLRQERAQRLDQRQHLGRLRRDVVPCPAIMRVEHEVGREKGQSPPTPFRNVAPLRRNSSRDTPARSRSSAISKPYACRRSRSAFCRSSGIVRRCSSRTSGNSMTMTSSSRSSSVRAKSVFASGGQAGDPSLRQQRPQPSQRRQRRDQITHLIGTKNQDPVYAIAKQRPGLMDLARPRPDLFVDQAAIFRIGRHQETVSG